MKKVFCISFQKTESDEPIELKLETGSQDTAALLPDQQHDNDLKEMMKQMIQRMIIQTLQEILLSEEGRDRGQSDDPSRGYSEELAMTPGQGDRQTSRSLRDMLQTLQVSLRPQFHQQSRSRRPAKSWPKILVLI